MDLSGVVAKSGRPNAIVGWVLVVLIVGSSIESVLTGAYLWGAFTLVSALVSVVPALWSRDWTEMVPWFLLALVALSAITRARELYPETSGYVAVATLALIFVIELDAYTQVDMSRRFAVVFAVLTTMAVQGLWVVAQFYSDRWLGTGFLRSQTELQWDLVIVTGVGFALGLVFQAYLTIAGQRRTGDRPSNRQNHDTQ